MRQLSPNASPVDRGVGGVNPGNADTYRSATTTLLSELAKVEPKLQETLAKREKELKEKAELEAQRQITKMSLPEINELVDKGVIPPSDNPFTKEALKRLASTRIGLEANRAMMEDYNTVFNKDTGNIEDLIDKYKKPILEQIGDDEQLNKGFYAAFNDTDRKIRDAHTEYSITKFDADNAQTISDIATETIKRGQESGATPQQISSTIYKQVEDSTKLIGLEPRQVEGFMMKSLEQFANDGQVDLVKAMLEDNRGKLGSLGKKAENVVVGQNMLATAEKVRDDRIYEGAVDFRIKADEDAMRGIFREPVMRQALDEKRITEAQYRGWKQEAMNARKRSEDDRQKAALIRASENSEKMANLETLSNMLTGNDYKNIGYEYITPTGSVKAVSKDQGDDKAILMARNSIRNEVVTPESRGFLAALGIDAEVGSTLNTPQVAAAESTLFQKIGKPDPVLKAQVSNVLYLPSAGGKVDPRMPIDQLEVKYKTELPPPVMTPSLEYSLAYIDSTAGRASKEETLSFLSLSLGTKDASMMFDVYSEIQAGGGKVSAQQVLRDILIRNRLAEHKLKTGKVSAVSERIVTSSFKEDTGSIIMTGATTTLLRNKFAQYSDRDTESAQRAAVASVKASTVVVDGVSIQAPKIYVHNGETFNTADLFSASKEFEANRLVQEAYQNGVNPITIDLLNDGVADLIEASNPGSEYEVGDTMVINPKLVSYSEIPDMPSKFLLVNVQTGEAIQDNNGKQIVRDFSDMARVTKKNAQLNAVNEQRKIEAINSTRNESNKNDVQDHLRQQEPIDKEAALERMNVYGVGYMPGKL